jgi:two-component system, OmpR family, phosphate regulon response regulator PhoB
VLDGTDFEIAAELARLHRPSLVILGPKLWLVSREEACSRFRSAPETSSAGIIMLGQSGEEHERVIALRSGADDCMTVPFSSAELIARIRAVLRRVPRADLDILRCGSLIMNLAAHRVWRDGRSVQLSPTDFRLLHHLMENPGRVFTRSELLNKVWGHDGPIGPRTVDVHVSARRLFSLRPHRRCLSRSISAHEIIPFLICQIGVSRR